MTKILWINGLQSRILSRAQSLITGHIFYFLVLSFLDKPRLRIFVDIFSISKSSNRWKASQTIFVSSITLEKFCCGSRLSCHLSSPYNKVTLKTHDHMFFTVSFSFSLFPGLPFWSSFSPFLICMCYSSNSKEVYMPLISQF